MDQEQRDSVDREIVEAEEKVEEERTESYGD